MTADSTGFGNFAPMDAAAKLGRSADEPHVSLEPVRLQLTVEVSKQMGNPGITAQLRWDAARTTGAPRTPSAPRDPTQCSFVKEACRWNESRVIKNISDREQDWSNRKAGVDLQTSRNSKSRAIYRKFGVK